MKEDIKFVAHLGRDGSADQPLVQHLLSVSHLAKLNAEQLGLGWAGAMLGLFHDLGKYSEDFQKYIHKSANLSKEEKKALRGTVDHSSAGAQTIWRKLEGLGGKERLLGQMLALCIASHHSRSGLIDCIAPDGEDNFSRRMNKDDATTHYMEALENVEERIKQAGLDLFGNPLTPVEDFITRICRIDKDDATIQFKIGFLTRFLFSCLIDADRSDTADSFNSGTAYRRQRGRYVEWPVLIGLLENHLASFRPDTPMNQIRAEISDHCLVAANRAKGISTLTAQTGAGKTLAALRFALHHAQKWNMNRIIYVSPYTSIIDQNAQVVRDILEPNRIFSSVVLEHHCNLTPDERTWKSQILSENWDSPIVFTTFVQLLEAMFGGGTQPVRRLHQLVNSVIIFDEIQTLPVRCVHLFNHAINFLTEHCGSSTVLCTATQPLLDRVDPKKGAIHLGANAEIIKDVPTMFARLKRFKTFDRRKEGGWTHEQAAQLIWKETRSYGNCLMIVNTKDEARLIYEECHALDATSSVKTDVD
jgi:CRISPR-associated endonuclease/helicase Cas3